MRWLVSRTLGWALWLLMAAVGLARLLLGAIVLAVRVLNKWYHEIRSLFRKAKKMEADVKAFAADQERRLPFDPERRTIFLLITCGQAVRNFLLSDVLRLLQDRFNVVILTPYAYSEKFREQFAKPGCHVLPWFPNFRSEIEKFFQYYLMRKSGSGTHQNWLTNLEARAKKEASSELRYKKHLFLRRGSDLLGALLGARGMQALFHSYYLAFLPHSMFKTLFNRYWPALVISTTAHHAEAWAVTYFARRYGCKTLGNILSWDNTTTKPAMDTSCDYYTVWSEEMRAEFARHYPYIKTKLIVTGCPLFDIYYNRPGALDRATFLGSLGLSPDLPYILWATNTPSAMPDESKIVADYWHALKKSKLAGKVGLLVRLHPKEEPSLYTELQREPNVAVTIAGEQHWASSDRWLPTERDMTVLLNSMMHAAVSVNVASTMTLESFALNLPTINIAFRAPGHQESNLLWSFDMFHTSDHYRAIIENDAVALVRSQKELLEATIDAIENGGGRSEGMRRTLELKAAYCDGTAARRFIEVVENILEPEKALAPSRAPADADAASTVPHATPAE
jgi:hypothetical protein